MASVRPRPRPSTSRRTSAPIAFMGDGGFWHNGLTSGIGNAVFNKHDGVIVVVDNYYSAATGGQDILPRAPTTARDRPAPDHEGGEGRRRQVGAQIDRTYDVSKMRDTLREALTTRGEGAEGDRRLVGMHAEPAAPREAAGRQGGQGRRAHGARALRCRRGRLHRRSRLHPPVGLPVAVGEAARRSAARRSGGAIDHSCVGCGNCGEVADAAVLCPSFYRADIIHNPSGWDRFGADPRRRLIGSLQRCREAGAHLRAEAA